MERSTFDLLLEDARAALGPGAIALERSVGADAGARLRVKVVTPSPLSALFLDTMCRPARSQRGSPLGEEPFTLIAVPRLLLDAERYRGRLRPGVPMCIATDFSRRIGIVAGTRYLGALKKLLFTVMNGLLPRHGILPLHCSVNRGLRGDVALFLGLSGTGKTTLSHDPKRIFIGDDEHAWNDEGVSNLEGGCYAKLFNLSADDEPAIHDAVFGRRHGSGVIVENALVRPDGTVDLADARLTENARAAYPLSLLEGADPAGVGGHPSTIVFLTADARGVLPPLALLSPEQALLWFLMGYTSKVAGTETGVKAPASTFSRFFGAPFMPLLPHFYLNMLRAKVAAHRCPVVLINTGWTGGPAGVGRRIDIATTRAIVRAALGGDLTAANRRIDARWGFAVPRSCPGVPARLLEPKRTWADPAAFERDADALASEFQSTFSANFRGSVRERGIADALPRALQG